MKQENCGRSQEDALERTLISLYSHEAPKGFQEGLRTALRQEAKRKQCAPIARSPWRGVLPAFATLLLAVGIWAVSVPPGERLEEGIALPEISPITSMSIRAISVEMDTAMEQEVTQSDEANAQGEAILLAETTDSASGRKVFGMAACAAALLMGGGIVAEKVLSKSRKNRNIKSDNDKGGNHP